jgi:hypothetical protein
MLKTSKRLGLSRALSGEGGSAISAIPTAIDNKRPM